MLSNSELAEKMARAVVKNHSDRANQKFVFDELTPGLRLQLIDDQLAALEVVHDHHSLS